MSENKTDWASPRLRKFIDDAQARHQEWRYIDLAKFDPALVTPDGDPQTLRIWVNAPSAVREELAALELYAGETFYNLLAIYTGMDTAALRDLFDAWEDPLRHFVVTRIFQLINEHRDERLNFLFS